MEDLRDLEEEEQIEEQVFLNERIFSPETKKVDMGMKKCTKMKTSRRIYFPPGRPVKEEA